MDICNECRFFFVVVIYNSSIKESKTCKCIEKYMKNGIVLIVDNSDIKNDNFKICKENGYKYIKMDGNQGLSKAYNRAIKYINKKYKNLENDFIVLLDDDTNIPKKYFSEIYSISKKNQNIDILIPIVYGQNGIIYSPNDAKIIKNKLIKSRSDIRKIKRINAINSCLCIKRKIFDDYSYDESLFLDQIDQQFFDDMRLKEKKVQVIDSCIYQNFFQRNKVNNKDIFLKRYLNRINDIMTYGRKNIYYVFCTFIKSICLSFQAGLKCKSFTITIKCLKITIKLFLMTFLKKGKA